MEFLRNYVAYLPIAIIAFLGAAGFIILKVVKSYSTTVAKANILKSAMEGPLGYFKSKKPDVEAEHPMTAWQELKLWIREHFFKLGLASDKSELSHTFNHTLKILKEQHGGKDYKYKQPLYLLLGTSESGKSTMMEELTHELPMGRHDNVNEEVHPTCKWWMFDSVIVLDIIGHCFLNKAGDTSDNRTWTKLLHLLAIHRASRPIDGVILTIPADELIGPKKLSAVEITARGKHIYQNLWHMQKVLGMKVPVYVVVTKCDRIPSFAGFSQELPSELLGELMGWSCPYSLETAYNASWVSDAFEYINRTLHKIRAEIFTEGNVSLNTDAVFSFKIELGHIHENLETYLNQIFKESSYQESYFLRGIYLAGDTQTHSAISEQKQANEGIGGNFALPFADLDTRRIAFIKDLFALKIFKEAALGTPIKNLLASTSKLLNLGKIAAAIFFALWGYGLWEAGKNLSNTNDILQPLMAEIEQTLHTVSNTEFDLNQSHNADLLNDQTMKILNKFTDLSVTSSFSPFIPNSWISNYDYKVSLAFAVTWNEIILKSMYTGLVQKSRELLVPLVIHEKESNRVAYLNPLDMPEFLKLQTYVNDAVTLESYIAKFNNLVKSRDIHDVGKIIHYLFKKDLPKQFYENDEYYAIALSNSKNRNIELNEYTDSARKKLDLWYNEFTTNAFNPNRSIANLEKLPEALDRLSHLNTAMANQMPSILNDMKLIVSIAGAIGNPKFNWIEAEVFSPGQNYSNVMNAIGSSRLFGTAVANKLSDSTAKDFQEYKTGLKDLQAPIIGTIFEQNAGKVLAKPSKSYASLAAIFKALLTQPFMQARTSAVQIKSIPTDRVLFWDEGTLRQATEISDKYQAFVTANLNKANASVSSMVDLISSSAMRGYLFDLIAKAQLFKQVPPSQSGSNEEEMLGTEAQNLITVLPYISKIVVSLNENDITPESIKFREVLSEQAQNILRGADKILTKDDLYGIGKDDLSWWEGQDMLGLKAFNVSDIDGMRSYLNAQKEKITFLARKIAEPAIKLLDLKYLSSTTKDINLVSKWNSILQQLDAYDKQTPGNSLTILENFLMSDINQMTKEICLDTSLSTENYPHTGDYFLSRLNHLYSMVINSCERINRTNAVNNYNKLSNFFNSYLAGKYPFSDKDDPSREEASASDLNQFLLMVMAYTEVDRNEIGKIHTNGPFKSGPLEFLHQIETGMPLLQATLDQNMEAGIPKVSYLIGFRTNRAQEAGADKVISWIVKIGSRKIEQASDKKDGEWKVGDGIAMSFRWASDSNVAPVLDNNQSGMSLTGQTATFAYQGRYSLIKLLKAHVSQFEKSMGTGPITLQFNIPTRAISSSDNNANFKSEDIARLFMSITLQDLDVNKQLDKAGRKLAPIFYSVPIFPTHAPTIK